MLHRAVGNGVQGLLHPLPLIQKVIVTKPLFLNSLLGPQKQEVLDGHSSTVGCQKIKVKDVFH